jgi:methionyl-tRNA formyltransferase
MGILKHHDYVKILNYYDIPISAKDSSKSIKHKAEAILAEKLCKCIKKVKKNDRQGEDSDDGNDDNKNTLSESESKAIEICSKSIF